MNFSTFAAFAVSQDAVVMVKRVALVTILLTTFLMIWTSLKIQELTIFAYKCITTIYKYVIFMYLCLVTAFVVYLDAIFVSLCGKGIFHLEPGKLQMDVCTNDLHGALVMVFLTSIFLTINWLTFKWVKGDVK